MRQVSGPACTTSGSALFVSSVSGIDFIDSAEAIADHGQSAQEIDRCFKSKLYVELPKASTRFTE